MRLRVIAAGISLLLLLAIAGCGSSSTSEGNGVASKSAEEIVRLSKVAADSASSVHVSGLLTPSDSSGPISLDMNLAAGKGGSGRLSENGLSFSMILVNQTAYIKGSPAFYRQFGGEAAVQLFKGKWLKASATTGDLAPLSSLADMRKLLDGILSTHGLLKKGAATTIDGQKAISITDTKKGGKLAVATTGKPYPLQVSKNGTENGAVKFDQWNKPVKISAPAEAIDIAELKAAGAKQ